MIIFDFSGDFAAKPCYNIGMKNELLLWYDQTKRDLPWRRTRDPYAVWLSEIMLQQTRAETVRAYWPRFLARFPDVQSLAAASQEEVLKLWAEFRRNGRLPEGELFHFRRNFAVYYREFVSDAHPVSEEYLKDVESPRPSREALARELWLQTEHLWTLFPGFIEALKA